MPTRCMCLYFFIIIVREQHARCVIYNFRRSYQSFWTSKSLFIFFYFFHKPRYKNNERCTHVPARNYSSYRIRKKKTYAENFVTSLHIISWRVPSWYVLRYLYGLECFIGLLFFYKNQHRSCKWVLYTIVEETPRSVHHS